MRYRKSVLGFGAAALMATGLGVTAPTVTAGEADSQKDVPTFQEFERSTAKDPQGQYIVNGDTPINGKKALRVFYDKMVEGDKVVKPGAGDTGHGLIVNTVGGSDDVWDATQAKSLTYCVSDDFGADKNTIVTAMEAGSGQWEAASSGVDFVYKSEHDGNCNTGNNDVLFSVEPVTGESYIARAFFPSTAKAERNVLVNMDQFGGGSWSGENVLAHELGHTLGFRHEHTRPEAGGSCFEDNNWRPLTPYDSASIMHYPQCNGSSDDLSMTEQDRAGIKEIYG